MMSDCMTALNQWLARLLRLALSVAMVFAVRVVLDMGLWSFVLVRSAADGVLHWDPLPPISETFMLVAVSEFGDLFCHSALA